MVRNCIDMLYGNTSYVLRPRAAPKAGSGPTLATLKNERGALENVH